MTIDSEQVIGDDVRNVVADVVGQDPVDLPEDVPLREVVAASLAAVDDRGLELLHYDCSATQRALEGSGISCPPLDCRLPQTYVDYLWRVGFLPEPAPTAGKTDREPVGWRRARACGVLAASTSIAVKGDAQR